jgi:hypothetical protein
MVGVEPRFEETTFKDDDDVRAFVADRSERRNISAGQKAMGHALVFPEPEKGGRGKKRAATIAGVSGFSETMSMPARFSPIRATLRSRLGRARRVWARHSMKRRRPRRRR